MPFRTLCAALVTLLLALAVPAISAEPVALLANGGFERDSWEWSGVWGHYAHDVTSDVSCSGQKSMYFWGSGAIKSMRYRYDGGPIEISGSYKLRNVKMGDVAYAKFWITVNYFNAAEDEIRHESALLADGTCDWTRFSTTMTPPAETHFIELSVAMHNCTGEAWVDDLQLKAQGGLDWPAWQYEAPSYYTGAILPTPRQVTYGNPTPLYDTSRQRFTIRTELGDNPCKDAVFGADQIDFRLSRCERFIRFDRPDCGQAKLVKIYLGRLDDAHIMRAAAGLGVDLPTSLPPQGHFVRTVESSDAIRIIAAGADNKGVVYAAASIYQMIGFENDMLVLRTFNLTDWPDFLLRASSDYAPIDDDWLSRMAMNKMSMYATQHRAYWKLVGPEEYAEPPAKGWSYEKRIRQMKAFIDSTDAIDLMILVHIYVSGGRPVEEAGPVFDIANEDNIADLTRRLKWLYDNGVYSQMICVDDYTDSRDREYVCKTKAEEEKFGNVGRAHGYLMRRLYEALAPDCPELKLSIVTAPYSTSHLDGPITRASGIHYLNELADEMPDEVAVCWTGPKITGPDISRRQWREYAAFAPGQPLYIWDNNQSGEPIADYVVNYYNSIHKDSAWSLMYQNSHFIGWPSHIPAALSGNAYMWNVGSYDAASAHQEACGKAFGRIDYSDVRTINDGYKAGVAMIRDEDRDLDALSNLIDNIYASIERLESIGAPMSVVRRQLNGASVQPDILKRFEALPTAKVSRLDSVPVIDGKLDDEAWKHVEEVSDFKQVSWAPGEEVPLTLHPTMYKFGYRGEFLYLGIACNHADVPLYPHENVGKRDGSIFFNSDTVEVFLGPDPAGGGYVHLAVDHTNTMFDERRPTPGSSWNGDWESAVTKADGVWYLEMRIPFSTLETPVPQPGDRWRANVCRSFGQNGELSCWAPIYGSFHNWTFFGNLEFE